MSISEKSFDLQVYEILVAARELISVESKWTTLLYARNANGDAVDPTSDNAVCFCSIGAIAKVVNDKGVIVVYHDESPAGRAREILYARMGDYISTFNDTHFHEEVLEKWDEAIRQAKVHTFNS